MHRDTCLIELQFKYRSLNEAVDALIAVCSSAEHWQCPACGHYAGRHHRVLPRGETW